MIRLGYKDSTMVWYHGAWRRLGLSGTGRRSSVVTISPMLPQRAAALSWAGENKRGRSA